MTLKGYCDIRWHSKVGAVKEVSTQLDEVTAAQENLRNILCEAVDTRENVALIINSIETSTL